MLLETLSPAQQCDRAGRAITQQLAWESTQQSTAERSADVLAEAREHVVLRSVDTDRVATDPVYRAAVLTAYAGHCQQLEITAKIYREAYTGKRDAATRPLVWSESYQTVADEF